MKHNRFGFTIVELLIVIVVIGILAAISIVAYNGVTNQANDSTIKSDLNNMAKKVGMYHAEHGKYPTRIEFLSSAFGTQVTKSAYDTSVYNLYYCVDLNQSRFGIASRSKSKKVYTISSNASVKEITAEPSWQASCGAFGETVLSNISFKYGYDLNTQTWASGLSG